MQHNKMKMKRKKGQSEIMGLAMIVVLITFGLLIFVAFSMRSESKNVATEFTFKQLPVLLNNAILETHVPEDECFGEKIQKLLIMSAEKSNIQCLTKQSTKEYSKEKITKILKDTLDQWNMEYIFTVYTGKDHKICQHDPSSSKCVFDITNSLEKDGTTKRYCRNMNINAETFFLGLSDGRILYIKLDLCS